MVQDTNATTAGSPASPPPGAGTPIAVRVVKWIAWRFAGTLAWFVLLLLLLSLADSDSPELALFRVAVKLRWDWLATRTSLAWVLWMTFGFAAFLSVALPNVRLPERLGRPLMGAALGAGAGLLVLVVLGGILSERGADRVEVATIAAKAAGRVNATEPDRHLPYMKFYPTLTRRMIPRGIGGGALIGLLAGCAWHAPGRARRMLVAAAIVVGAGVVTEACVSGSRAVDGWVEWQIEWLNRPRK